MAWRLGLVERRLWYVRRNGEVKGPFMSAQITRNILLGRIRPNDELSTDEKNWQTVAVHRELYPDVMQESPIDNEKLENAKVQEDERVLEQRKQKQNMAQERRRTRDRRGVESDVMLMHRQHRNDLADTYKHRIKRPQLPILSILLIMIVIIVSGYVLTPENKNLQSGCALPPAKGVNWSNCNFVDLNIENQSMESSILTDATLNQAKLLGANFSGSDMAYAEITKSDLSYANLEKVRLIGADLKHSDLRYANLKDADLSYADLSNALLAGANISNTKFDNTIWTNGQICKKGSVGSCR